MSNISKMDANFVKILREELKDLRRDNELFPKREKNLLALMKRYEEHA